MRRDDSRDWAVAKEEKPELGIEAGETAYSQTPSLSCLLRCSVSLVMAVLGPVIVNVNSSIQSHMSNIITNNSAIRLFI